MAHLLVHFGSAAVLFAIGEPYAAVGALVPDLSWVRNELRIRAALPTSPHETIAALTDAQVRVYRIAHSILLWCVAALVFVLVGEGWAVRFVFGVVLHIVLDLPTHDGRMRQLPLYPFRWRWPWVLRKYRTALQ